MHSYVCSSFFYLYNLQFFYFQIVLMIVLSMLSMYFSALSSFPINNNEYSLLRIYEFLSLLSLPQYKAIDNF